MTKPGDRAHQLAQQSDDFRAVLRIQISRRLVGQNDLGLVHDRPCHRDPLLLSPRKLARPMRGAMRHPAPAPDLGDAFPDSEPLLPSQQERKGHVLFDGQTWDQVKGLKDNANGLPANLGPILCAETGG